MGYKKLQQNSVSLTGSELFVVRGGSPLVTSYLFQQTYNSRPPCGVIKSFFVLFPVVLGDGKNLNSVVRKTDK
jgi:hypothetical protein